MARPFSQDWEKRMAAGQRPRPTSDTAAMMNFTNGRRPYGGEAAGLGWYPSTEARAIDRWFEDLSNYEKTLEEMSELKLMDSFKEELRVVDSWFIGQNESERTTVLYALLRHCTPLQVRFFMTVLDQMAKTDPIASILSPRNSMISPRTSVTEDTVRAGAMLDLEEREMEASRRLLQKLPPVHHHDESPSESESTKSQSRRLYDRHSSGTLNPISPVTPVMAASADAWMSSSAAGSSSSLFAANPSNPLAAAGSALSGAVLSGAQPGSASASTPTGSAPLREPLKPLRPAPAPPVPGVADVVLGPLGGLGTTAGVAPASTVAAAAAAASAAASAAAVQAAKAVAAVSAPPASAGIAMAPSARAVPAAAPSAAALPPAGGALASAPAPAPAKAAVGVPAAASVAGRRPSGSDVPTADSPAAPTSVPQRGAPAAPSTSAPAAASPTAAVGVRAPSSPVVPPPPPVVPPALSTGPVPPTFSAIVARSLASPTAAAATAASTGHAHAHSTEGSAATGKARRGSIGSAPAPLVVGLAGAGVAKHSPTSGLSISTTLTGAPAGTGSGEGTPRDNTDPTLPPDDIPSWLKTLRLHKYSNLFEQMTWPKMLKLDEDKLQEMGMGALGARRKLLKAIESVANGEPVSPTGAKF